MPGRPRFANYRTSTNTPNDTLSPHSTVYPQVHAYHDLLLFLPVVADTSPYQSRWLCSACRNFSGFPRIGFIFRRGFGWHAYRAILPYHTVYRTSDKGSFPSISLIARCYPAISRAADGGRSPGRCISQVLVAGQPYYMRSTSSTHYVRLS